MHSPGYLVTSTVFCHLWFFVIYGSNAWEQDPMPGFAEEEFRRYLMRVAPGVGMTS
jgi:hypothetical protein